MADPEEVKLKPTVATHVAQAVVRLPRLGGQGVAVPGGFIVTAAHCLAWTAESWMALMPMGDDSRFHETIVTAAGQSLVVQPLAVEPVSDLAVLGAVDDMVWPEQADAFESFCATTKPVRLATERLDVGVPLAAYVFTHDKGIVPARATLWAGALGTATLFIEVAAGIDGGTSGGPVVTRNGRLLGIMSTVGGVLGQTLNQATITRVHLAAPVWLVRQMVPRAAHKKLNTLFPPGRYRRRIQR